MPRDMKMNSNVSELRKLEKVALGKMPADLILSGGDVLNVYTGEVVKNQTVLITGERIAYVGADSDFPRGLTTKVIELDGKLLIPGFIDAHCHMDFWMGLKEYTTYSLPRGTTSIVTECPAVTNALGIKGVRGFLDLFQNLPQRFYATAPIIPFLCSIREGDDRAVSTADMEEILAYPEILGLGEVYWSRLIDGDPTEGLIELILLAKALGKTVEGHGAGAKNRKLAAMTAVGVESCHEPISAEDVRDRLRLGLNTMIREGSIRRELETVIKPLVEMDLNLRKASLVSDGVWPEHLIEHGHMDYIVNKAISLGLDPVQAIQMATLNPAEHFQLEKDLGGIAPGKCADLLVIPNLHTIKAELVICKGQVVGREGLLQVQIEYEKYPTQFLKSLKLAEVEPDSFRVTSDGLTAKVWVMDMITDIVNRPAILELPVVNGVVQAEGMEDVLKAVALDRFEGKGRKHIGYIKGFGLRQGAVATSFSFDEGNAVVIGCNDVDLAVAANRLRELQGGIVYACNGRVSEELALPVFGTISELPGPEVATRINLLIATLREMGCSKGNPLLTLLTSTFTAIPSIRLSVNGYWLSKENTFTGLFVK